MLKRKGGEDPSIFVQRLVVCWRPRPTSLTCASHVGMLGCMSTLQVRNLPAKAHQALRVRAAKAGLSLSEYVGAALERLALEPTMDEFLERVRLRGAVDPEVSAVDVLAAERASRP